MQSRNYTLPASLNVGAANNIVFNAPFNLTLNIHECFAHVTTVLVGGATIEVRVNGVSRGTVVLPANAALNSTAKASPSGSREGVFAEAGQAVGFFVTTPATSGAISATLAYSPAIG